MLLSRTRYRFDESELGLVCHRDTSSDSKDLV